MVAQMSKVRCPHAICVYFSKVRHEFLTSQPIFQQCRDQVGRSLRSAATTIQIRPTLAGGSLSDEYKIRSGILVDRMKRPSTMIGGKLCTKDRKTGSIYNEFTKIGM